MKSTLLMAVLIMLSVVFPAALVAASDTGLSNPVVITVQSSASFAVTIYVDGKSVTSPASFAWNPGDVHNLDAVSSTGRLTYWTSPSIGAVPYPSISYTVPSASETVTATDQPQASTVLITLTSNPATGVSLAVDSSFIATPQVFDWTPGSLHVLSASSMHCTMSNSSQCPNGFLYWQSPSIGVVTAGTISYIVPSLAETVTAYYQGQGNVAITITENPSESGGQILVDGNPVRVPFTFFWPPGSQHALLAEAGSGGYRFNSWNSPSVGADNADPTLYIVPQSPEVVTAIYSYQRPPPVISITISSNSSSGVITVDGTRIDAPKTFQWAQGSTHKLSAQNGDCTASGCRVAFIEWKAPSIRTAITKNLTYTVPAAPETVTALFNLVNPVPEFASAGPLIAVLILATALIVTKTRHDLP